MLPFSQYLRELLETKQLTVSALSRLSGVERTTLSKTLAGQRVLPYDAMDGLIRHLHLTPEEERRFRAYYDEQFEKKGLRRSREMVGRLFSELAELNFTMPPFAETRLLMSLEQYAGDRSVFSGASNVQPLLRMVLSEELMRADARIDLTVPPVNSFLSDELLRRCLDGGLDADIRQIIAFDASGSAEDINLHNLECFCRILPICLLSKRRYQPYYYYDSSLSSLYTDSFPYFLVTHSCVVCLFENGEQAMLLRGRDQIEYYRRHFQNLLEHCYRLIQYTDDPVKILMSYDDHTDENGFYMIMDQPCFGRFYNEGVIDRYLKKELSFYEPLREAAQRRFIRLRQIERFYTLFSRGGIERFLESGALDDFPSAYVKPFPAEQRRKLTMALAAEIRRGGITGRMLKPGVFPDYLSMTTSARSGAGFFTTENFALQDGFSYIRIRESDLCRAFHGYLSHLPVSGQTLSADQTAEILEQMAQER